MQASPQSSITRRRHSAAFKAEVLAECRRSGASVAATAQMYGINANLVHKWRRDSLELVSAKASSAAIQPVEFIELPMPLPTAVQAHSQPPSNIEVELQRGKVVLKVRWPVSAAADCAAWLRGVLA